MPNISEFLQPFDKVIDDTFIPAITEGHICSKDERLLLSLPVKLGGLGIPIFSQLSKIEYQNSRKLTEQSSSKIKDQTTEYQLDEQLQTVVKKTFVKEREEKNKEILVDLRSRMTPDMKKANKISQLKGASSWLSSLPLKSENFSLNKREFYDSIRLRYRWRLKFLPSTCVCGKPYNEDHAMACQRGGYIHHRHNEIRDLFIKLAEEISNDVEYQPSCALEARGTDVVE
eukprot:gene19271-biopygen16156